MVVLEILGTKVEDSGTYTCRATNKWGRAEISVNLECVERIGGQKPQFTTQLKVCSKIYNFFLRSLPKQRQPQTYKYEYICIITNLQQCHFQSLAGLKDGDSAHFECTLVPVNDQKLKVEWFHNGQPLHHKNRIKMVSDFGFVVMDIAYVQNHDSGEYVCKASNE